MSPAGRVVLVVGPPLAGVDGVVAALRRRLPEDTVTGIEGCDPRRPPDAVVGVVSAAAPMTVSDWDLLARAASRTGLLIGAVSKIDAHRNWRAVLDTDRALAAEWSHRHAPSWVGVAAAPHLGETDVADLVATLRAGLVDPGRRHRSPRHDDTRVAPRPTLKEAESRIAVQRVRLRLLRFVRDECASMRAELRDAAAAVPAGGSERFEARVRADAGTFLGELDLRIAREVAVELAAEFPSRSPVGRPDRPTIAGPPSGSRRLETRLVAVLGLSVGLGIALASNRLLAGLAPDLAGVGWVVGGVVGSAMVAWVVRSRAILHDRALLDRWVTDVVGTLRWHGEAAVAERLLAVEPAHPNARSRSTNGPAVSESFL